jgi:GGDEF domain-containing protein
VIIKEVDWPNQKSVKALLVPGGLIFFAAWIAFGTKLISVSPSAVTFYYYAAFAAGLVLAWRFHSSKVLFALLFLLLGHRAAEFFSSGHIVASGPGRIAFEAVCFLLPVNVVVLSVMRERGLGLNVIAPRLGILFFESVFVAIICRAGETTAPGLFHVGLFPRDWFGWTKIPQVSVLLFIAALTVLAVRFFLYRKPAESGMFWSLAGFGLAMQYGGVTPLAGAFMATAGVILSSSIVETSYALAYNDELTSLPSRRSFNESSLRLNYPFALAVVDIDHFKNFNDSYGHDTGDQVLRMVATKLAEVTGGGKAFRTGGEEFCILFPGKHAPEIVPHLDLLRKVIEGASFQLRTSPILVPPSEERRKPSKKKPSTRIKPAVPRGGDLSVTVSIGVAESRTAAQQFDQILRAADKALYRAKQAGRNRVEVATPAKPRAVRAPKRSIA